LAGVVSVSLPALVLTAISSITRGFLTCDGTGDLFCLGPRANKHDYASLTSACLLQLTLLGFICRMLMLVLMYFK